MKRRTFLLLTLLTFFTKSFAQTNTKNQLQLIKAVLNHLFPNTSEFQGAENFGAMDFFLYVTKHPTFDSSDFNFIIEGADKLNNFNNDFINLNAQEKEKTLREFEKTTFGQNWLSLLLNYGLEAMLGDPIYKGNKNLSGWKNIHHSTPIPTATKPFGQIL